MEKIKFKIPEEGQRRLISESALQYSNPLHALREYLTNAIDAIDDGKINDGLVKILLSQNGKSVIVEDNASGMNEKKVRSLPVEIGVSAKQGRLDQRGEKAVGLLAFGSMGYRMHIITRTKEEQYYNYLRYEKNEDNQIEDPEFTKLTTSEVIREFYGTFHHGTRIIVNTNPDILKRNLTETAIEKFVQETYFPLMQTRRISLKIGNADNGSLRKVTELEMNGDILLNQFLTFQAKSKGELKDYQVFAYLIFNPEIENGKVSVYSKDVKVYNSVVQLEESLAELDFWKCRQITGYINEPNLKITLGREGINRDSNAYKSLVSLLEQIHENYWPQISEQLKKRKAVKGNRLVDNAWEDLEKAYQVTEPINIIPRGPPQNPKPHTPNPNPITRNPRRFPFGKRFEQFGLGQEKLRSKLETDLGYPVVVINNVHPDYKTNVQEGDEKSAKEYVFDISAPIIALWETEKLIERGGSLGDQYEMVQTIARRAQDLKYASTNRKNGKKK